MIWREKRVLLSILGLLLAADVVFFLTYRVQYESRLRDSDERLHQSETRLAEVHATRLAAERRIAAYRSIQRDIDWVYNEKWSTQDARLTALISEVKRMALASSLIPRSYSFTQTEDKKNNNDKGQGANTVNIAFNVEGTYEQARHLINLLELSPQFIIVDQIALHSAQDKVLTLTLQLKTLFRDPTVPQRPAGASREL
jgi:Tfp pilus assembly protein PilO